MKKCILTIMLFIGLSVFVQPVGATSATKPDVKPSKDYTHEFIGVYEDFNGEYVTVHMTNDDFTREFGGMKIDTLKSKVMDLRASQWTYIYLKGDWGSKSADELFYYAGSKTDSDDEKYYRNLLEVDISDLNTSSVTSFNQMFQNCYSLEDIDFGDMSTSKGLTFDSMFEGTTSLSSINLDFDTSSAKSFQRMFYGATGFTSISLNDIETNGLRDINFSQMFFGTKNLTSLSIKGIELGEGSTLKQSFANTNPELTVMVNGNSKTLFDKLATETTPGVRFIVANITNYDVTLEQEVFPYIASEIEPEIVKVTVNNGIDVTDLIKVQSIVYENNINASQSASVTFEIDGYGSANGLTKTFTITPAKLEWTIGVVANKTYDGKLAATVLHAPILSGFVGNDTPDSLSMNVVVGNVSFENAEVGVLKNVNATGYSVGFTDVEKMINYEVPTEQPKFEKASILAEGEDVVQPTTPGDTGTPGTTPTQPTSKGPSIGLIIGIVIGVVAIVGGIIIVIKNKKKNEFFDDEY